MQESITSRYEEIASLLKSGLSYAAIGRKLALSREWVRRMAKGHTRSTKKRLRNGSNTILTVTEAAEMLNVHVNTIRRWSDGGLLNTYRVGPRGDRRFKRCDIAKLLLKKPARTQGYNVGQSRWRY